MTIRTLDEASGTQERLLAAARELFPEQGYQGTTTAEICERAGTNGAAINYHFRSKGGLYLEVWRQHFEGVRHRIQSEAPDQEGLAPDERLHRRIRALLGHVLEVGSFGRLWLHELVRPTGLIQEFRREALQSVRQGMRVVLADLLGQDATEHDITLCQMSVANQCLALGLQPLYIEDLLREGGDRLDVDELADHITRFSLAGIRDMRRRYASREN